MAGNLDWWFKYLIVILSSYLPIYSSHSTVPSDTIYSSRRLSSRVSLSDMGRQSNTPRDQVKHLSWPYYSSRSIWSIENDSIETNMGGGVG